jgi:hypothetical protein
LEKLSLLSQQTQSSILPLLRFLTPASNLLLKVKELTGVQLKLLLLPLFLKKDTMSVFQVKMLREELSLTVTPTYSIKTEMDAMYP